MDEESFILSPINYDLFDFMKSNNYAYGYRLCSYELSPGQKSWNEYTKQPQAAGVQPYSPFKGRCGFYNNFFIAEIDFFRSAPVYAFLQWADQQGCIYRDRLSDLVLQSIAVYSFCPPGRVHRFLDFTYEHVTRSQPSGCPWWGAIQAGYNDHQGQERIANWARVNVYEKKCQVQTPVHLYKVRVVDMMEPDLSPTFAHLPHHIAGRLRLAEVSAGLVDVVGKGELSGGALDVQV